jgi:hypothetical protein
VGVIVLTNQKKESSKVVAVIFFFFLLFFLPSLDVVMEQWFGHKINENFIFIIWL